MFLLGVKGDKCHW